MARRYRIGVDIGGTFTDFAMVDDQTGAVIVEKRLTTPDEPQQAVIEGMRQLAETGSDILANADAIIHATTLLTNVILERKGASTGLLTTEGFRDILEFARELRYDVYDPFITFPAPLVERPFRLEIRERVLVDGSVRVPLDEGSVRQAARIFDERGVHAVAISFLHAYRNPEHERRARDILLDELPKLQVSLSSEVHPEPKEYERTSTTVVDAYVKPTAARYLDKLSSSLRHEGYRHSLFVMLSNGGVATARATKQFPVQAVESGPAAGVEAAAHYGRMMGVSRLLSFDMGGTTAKLCVVLDGKPARTRSFEVDRVQRFKPGSGIPIAVPVYDLLEIGSGGGSVARRNSLGLLQVGPDSAGSKPGPVCYGRGGAEPTVTDADLVLGFLDAERFLGGEMVLSTAVAERVIEEQVGSGLGLSVVDAAWGIHNLVNETMASAARVHIAEKGQAARNLTLMAFGGAGPVHAIGLARKLGCPTVVVPPLPGVMSAFGLLTAPLAIERPRAVQELLADLDCGKLERWSRELEQDAAALLPDGSEPAFVRTIDVRRVGQDYPLEITLEGAWADPGFREQVEQAFDKQYASHYGRVDDETPLEVVTLRVKACRPVRQPAIRSSGAGEVSPAARTRRVYVPGLGRYDQVPVYARGKLPPGSGVSGPAIVEERESTTVIDRGDTLVVDRFGCLVITLAY